MTMVDEPKYGSVLLITVFAVYSSNFQDARLEHPMFVMLIFIQHNLCMNHAINNFHNVYEVYEMYDSNATPRHRMVGIRTYPFCGA